MYRRFGLLLILSFVSSQEYIARCSDNLNKSLTFKPTNDGVEGRYSVEWCTQADTNMRVWDITLRFYNNKTSESCRNYNFRTPKGIRHSEKSVNVDFDCVNVCLTTYFDLIFNGSCYHINTKLRSSSFKSSQTEHGLFYVQNQLSVNHFSDSQTTVLYRTSKDKELVTWYLGYVPATQYTVELCVPDNYTHVETCQEENNCDTMGEKKTAVSCNFTAPSHCYMLRLKHKSAWSGAAVFSKISNANYNICLSESSGSNVEQPVVADVGGAVRWAGAAVAVGGAALLLLLVARSRHVSALRAKVLREWQTRLETEPPPKPVMEGHRVLLIYARDCDQFTRVVQLLKGMLQRTGCQVVDIFSSEVVAASARAPAEWLRRLASDPGTRLLLLQGPAAAALYSTQLTRVEPHLSAPLLGRVAVRRVPHPADSTAILALRMLGEAAHRPLAYRKCYVASIESLDVELVPGVTPQRRYVLPAYTEVLLRDLSPGSDVVDTHVAQSSPVTCTQDPDYTERIQELTGAIGDLIDHVRRNPDYLTDELLFI